MSEELKKYELRVADNAARKAKGQKPLPFEEYMSETALSAVLDAATRELDRDQSFLRVSPPCQIWGDLNGGPTCNFHVDPKDKQFNFHRVFLGNYATGDENAIENLWKLMVYKITYPSLFFFLRGCTECPIINRCNGFYDECVKRYSEAMWDKFNKLFCNMSYWCLIEEKILCVHAGVPDNTLLYMELGHPGSNLGNFGAVQGYGFQYSWEGAHAADLVLADYDVNAKGSTPRDVKPGVVYGPDHVTAQAEYLKVTNIIRSHGIQKDGVQQSAKGILTSVYSALNNPTVKGMRLKVPANLHVMAIPADLDEKEAGFGWMTSLFKSHAAPMSHDDAPRKRARFRKEKEEKKEEKKE